MSQCAKNLVDSSKIMLAKKIVIDTCFAGNHSIVSPIQISQNSEFHPPPPPPDHLCHFECELPQGNHQKYPPAILFWFQFICAVEDVKQVYDDLSNKFSNRVLSSELEYFPRKLVSLSDEPLQQAQKLIDTLEDHLDVVRVYDNIEQFPSMTCKLFSATWPSLDPELQTGKFTNLVACSEVFK